jgi:hypothetical protein
MIKQSDVSARTQRIAHISRKQPTRNRGFFEQDRLDGELPPNDEAATAGERSSTEMTAQKASVLKQDHHAQANQRDAAE